MLYRFSIQTMVKAVYDTYGCVFTIDNSSRTHAERTTLSPFHDVN